jgi:hypothetical protein
MLFFSHDALRDPIWQFLGVIISTVLSAVGLFLPYFVRNRGEQEKLQSAYKALFLQDNSLGCAGFIGLLVLLIAVCYSLYHLLIRMFLLDRAYDQSTLVATIIIIVLFLLVFFTHFRQNQLLLLLAFHFCVVSLIFSLIVVSLRLGTFVYKDFTFVKLFLAHYISPINNIPIQLKKIPVDIVITDRNRTAAQTVFIWVYGFSLCFFLFFYGVDKRTKGLLAFLRSHARRAEASLVPAYENQSYAFADQTPERREIILQELDKQDKELALEVKRLDVEKQRVIYARDLSLTLVDTLEPEADSTTRAMLVRQFLPDFLQLGTIETSAIIAPHLKSRRASPAPLAFLETTSKKSSPSCDAVVPDVLHLDYYHAAELALRAGMKVVVKGEVMHLDVDPGTIVYQYPAPESCVHQPLDDTNDNRLEISVILSRQKSYEAPVLPALPEMSYYRISLDDEAPQPGLQEPPLGEGTSQPESQGTLPGDENQQHASQGTPPGGETQQNASQEPPPGDEASQNSFPKPPKEKESQKKKPGKHHKKPHGKGEHEHKTLPEGETPQRASQKKKRGKHHKKPHGKDKHKESLNTAEVAQTVSQKLQEEKPVELPVDDTLDAPAQSSVADQDNKEQIAPIEDDQTSEALNDTAQLSSMEDYPTLTEPVEDVEEISLPPSLTTEPVDDVEEGSQTSSLSGEQPIYLGPDDQLVEALELIARARTRQILLVLPPQTQMRSSLSWRLLHRRARELGKNVQVVSKDRQVRAVARAAGFIVLDPLAPSASRGMRPTDHTSRSRTVRNTGQGRPPLRAFSSGGDIRKRSEESLADL